MSKASRTKRKGWNWAPVPAAVIMSENLTHADVRVYAYLLWRSGEDDRSWPRVDTIAGDLHMSEPAVKRSFKNLIKDNWIRRSRRVGHSSYTYIFEHQEDCLAFDKDPTVVSSVIRREITGDTVNVSQVIPLNESQYNENQKNKKDDEAPPPHPNIFTLYEQNIGVLTPILAEKLKAAETDYPDFWISKAIEIAVSNERRSWGYVEAILRRWKVDGFNSDTRPRNGRAVGKNAGAPAEPKSLGAVRKFAEKHGVNLDEL